MQARTEGTSEYMCTSYSYLVLYSTPILSTPDHNPFNHDLTRLRSERLMAMPAANVDIGRPEDSFMRRTRTVSPADLGQAFDRVALGKSDYFNHYKQYRIDELTAASLPPKQQDAQIQDSIEIICRYAYQSGLSIPTLTATLEIVIGSKSLSRSNRAMLIKSLYPAGEVPSRLICIAVASLGQGKQKLSVSLQQSLLKWIILVYEVLEDPSVLSRLYSVLFNMLDVTSLRYDIPVSV